MAPDYLPPAARLEGRTLDDGFVVKKLIQIKPHATGSNFSCGYIVEKDSKEYFLKALDYSRALASEDPAAALQLLTRSFLHERDICFHCKDRKLTRVVLPVTTGKVLIDDKSAIGTVEYIIFEKAEGDVRSIVVESESFDVAWAMRTLHGVAAAIKQLHGEQIAHQDVKPSNVLMFGLWMPKLGDFGRSSQVGKTALHDGHGIAGDPVYAPPELFYGNVPSDWATRRYGCDAYMFGNLLPFFFANANMSSLLQDELDLTHKWGRWAGSYSELLPYLVDAFGKTLNKLERNFPTLFRSELRGITYELCHPDPSKRGHPKDRALNQFSMERYISAFNRMAKKAEIALASPGD